MVKFLKCPECSTKTFSVKNIKVCIGCGLNVEDVEEKPVSELDRNKDGGNIDDKEVRGREKGNR